MDARARVQGARGPLHGLPVLLDDTIDVRGLPTTAGSIALQKTLPSADSAIVAKLKAAGAIILGKTNVGELNGLLRREHARGLLVARWPGAAGQRHRQLAGWFLGGFDGIDRRGLGGADVRPGDLDRHGADHRAGGYRRRGRPEADGRPGVDRTACSALASSQDAVGPITAHRARDAGDGALSALSWHARTRSALDRPPWRASASVVVASTPARTRRCSPRCTGAGATTVTKTVPPAAPTTPSIVTTRVQARPGRLPLGPAGA